MPHLPFALDVTIPTLGSLQSNLRLCWLPGQLPLTALLPQQHPAEPSESQERCSAGIFPCSSPVMAEAALQRSVLIIFCHPLGCSSSSAAHLPSLPPPRSFTSCYCWQSRRGQTAPTDTYGPVNLLLGHTLALEGHTPLVSRISLFSPLPLPRTTSWPPPGISGLCHGTARQCRSLCAEPRWFQVPGSSVHSQCHGFNVPLRREAPNY